MPHTSGDTVLQVSSEDLPIAEGPTGATGTTGATGPGVNTNLLTLLISMDFTVGGIASYASPQTTITYLVYDGTKFAATGSHVVTTAIVNQSSRIIGSMTGFLATATDPYMVEAIRQKIIYSGGVLQPSTGTFYWDVNVYQKTNNEFWWGISMGNVPADPLGSIGNVLDTFEFSINITA